MRTNGHFFDWGFGLAWTALVALIVSTAWLAMPAKVEALSSIAYPASHSSSEDPAWQWWEDMWATPYEDNMLFLVETPLMATSNVQNLHLMEIIDGNVVHLDSGQFTDRWRVPLPQTTIDTYNVTFLMGDPPKPILATIQHEIEQWAGVMHGPDGITALVLVHMDHLHISSESNEIDCMLTFGFPLLSFDEQAYHEFIDSTTAAFSYQPKPGNQDCDGNAICVICANWDDCLTQAGNTYNLAVAQCSRLNIWSGVGATIGLAGSSAALGAGLGSVVPVFGTVIGAVCGVIGAGVAGAMAGGELGRRECLRIALAVLLAAEANCWAQHDPFPNTSFEENPCMMWWLDNQGL